MAMVSSGKQRIVVPVRPVNGGFDLKYETDPYNIKLYDIMASQEYEDAITRVNDRLRPSRSKIVDTACLVTGPLLVPLAVWGVRHNILVRRRKKLLKEAIQEFNETHQGLYMRYNRRPESCLTIEKRVDGASYPPPPLTPVANSEMVVMAEPMNSSTTGTYATNGQALYSETYMEPLIQHAESFV